MLNFFTSINKHKYNSEIITNIKIGYECNITEYILKIQNFKDKYENKIIKFNQFINDLYKLIEFIDIIYKTIKSRYKKDLEMILNLFITNNNSNNTLIFIDTSYNEIITFMESIEKIKLINFIEFIQFIIINLIENNYNKNTYLQRKILYFKCNEQVINNYLKHKLNTIDYNTLQYDKIDINGEIYLKINRYDLDYTLETYIIDKYYITYFCSIDNQKNIEKQHNIFFCFHFF